MEDIEIINTWKSYDKKLEENLIFNKKITNEIIKMKVQSFLALMMPLKIFTVLIGLVWVIFVDILIVNLFQIANPFFLISAGIQVVLTKLAIGTYLYQLILIHQTNRDEPILVTQIKVASLKSTTLWVARLLFLQFPVWTTFYWNESMLRNGNVWLYILQIIVTASFTYLAVWLFLNIKYENRDKKWFLYIFNGTEWNPVMKSLELLSQIKEYKNETERSVIN